MTDSHPALKNGVLFLAHDVEKNKGYPEILMGRLESIPFSSLECTMIIVRVTGADYSVTDKYVFTKILVYSNCHRAIARVIIP